MSYVHKNSERCSKPKDYPFKVQNYSSENKLTLRFVDDAPVSIRPNFFQNTIISNWKMNSTQEIEVYLNVNPLYGDLGFIPWFKYTLRDGTDKYFYLTKAQYSYKIWDAVGDINAIVLNV